MFHRFLSPFHLTNKNDHTFFFSSSSTLKIFIHSLSDIYMAVLLLHLQHPSSSSSFQFKFPSMITTLAPYLIIKDRRRKGVIKVFSRIKDIEPWLLNDVRNSSAATSSDDEEKQTSTSSGSYYVNTGNAIQTLRHDFPDLFYRNLTNFDIYRDDIVFKDPLNTFYGIQNYKTIFSALRLSGRIFFKALRVQIISVSQPVETTIMIRWAVHGISRVPWERRARFDATSEYKLDKSGKIYQHLVHNVALNAPPKFQVLSIDDLIQSLGCPKATYFETDTRPMK